MKRMKMKSDHMLPTAPSLFTASCCGFLLVLFACITAHAGHTGVAAVDSQNFPVQHSRLHYTDADLVEHRIVQQRLDQLAAAASGSKEVQVQGTGSITRAGNTCTAEDIVIVQGPVGRLPNGIPSFMVTIYNVCMEKGCGLGRIYVSCGEFASVQLVDPAVFRREAVDKCVVKGGHSLAAGQAISFLYANAAPYPLSVFSASRVCAHRRRPAPTTLQV